MDQRPIRAEPSAVEQAAVDAVLGPPPVAWDGPLARISTAGGPGRDMLLPALHALAGATGWVSPGGLGYACRRLDVPPAEAYGVASFYSLLGTEERPPVVVHVCDDVACLARGAGALVAGIEAAHGPELLGGAAASWVRSPCLGMCDRAPAVLALGAGEVPWHATSAPATVASVAGLLSGEAPASRGGAAPGEDGVSSPRIGGTPFLLRRVAAGSSPRLAAYRAAGGYESLRRALRIGREAVIAEVTAAGLLGRGGAAFPTGRKWQAVASAPERPHYMVCNADESEPGTFKDRVLLERDPFAVIEAMTLAGWATGCERGFLYIRGEYPRAAEVLARAAAEAREMGVLGEDVMGEGFCFDLEIRRGAGAYICGEETALFNSIEGRRGEPRNKPPFPTQVGLFGRPTLVNNVETLVNVLAVLASGAKAYGALGTPSSAGTRLFCVSGCVATPGLYELEHGATLGELVGLAGGTLPGRELRAVLLGGAAGSFVGPDRMSTELSFEGARSAGATLGSGAVVVFDDTVDLAAVLLRIARFFRDESCGQCVPCRVGTVRQEEILRRILDGAPCASLAAERETLRELAQAMRDASICGLGQTASGAILSGLDLIGVGGAP